MALTVDQLLAAESSSDEETPVGGSRPAGGPGAPGAESGAPRSSADGPASGGGGRGLAALLGENSDDEEEEARSDAGAAAAAAPQEESRAPAASGSRDGRASAGVDQLSDTSDGPRDRNKEAQKKVGLDEILAMDSDSSGEHAGDAGTRVSQAAAAPPAREREPLRAADGALGAAGAAGAREGEASQASDDVGAFLSSPFAWCSEHERKLLLGNIIEDPAAGEDPGDECGGLSADQMFETRQCAELQKLLSRELGLPTCVFAHEKFVAVGTIRGAVVLVDPKLRDVGAQPQVLCPPSNEEGAAVTSAACSSDGSSILLGHKNGHLSLWDIGTQKLAQSVKDVHKNSVLSVAFTRASWQYTLSADAGGTVHFLSFTSTFGRRDYSSQLLLDKASNIGVTLRISPLPPMPHQATHPADTHCLVALCATNATVLLTLHPSPKLLQKMQYNTKDAAGHATWVPDVAWLRPEIQDPSESEKPIDPRLCIAFGQTIHIMRISYEADEFKIKLIHRYTWSAPIWSITAFNEGLFGVLDTSDKLSVVQLPPPLEGDRPAGAPEPSRQLAPVHVEDVSGTPLVYHTHTSLDGSKDSRSHHGALAVFKGRSRTLYFCGMKEVWHLQIGRWGQRIEELIGRGAWAPALSALLALKEGRLPPLLDFPHVAGARQRAVSSRTTQVIQSYLASRLHADTNRIKVRQMCATAVHACVEMQLWPVLYKTVFECFKAAGHMNVYCNTLEPCIVKGRIPRGRMDPEVLSSILQSYALRLEEEEQLAVQHFKGAGSAPQSVDSDHCAQLFPIARRLQQLVLYVDVLQLDLNLTIRLFTQHRLWTALVHVYCSMKDYAAPLETLVGECSQLAKGCQQQALPSDEGLQEETPLLQCLLVRKLFFYLLRCFEQRPFPLDAEDSPGLATPGPDAIADLLMCILKPGTDSVDGRPRAPPVFLRLLRLSPVGFFGALSALFTCQAASDAVQSLAERARPCLIGGAQEPPSLASLFDAIEAAVEASHRQAEDEGQPLPPGTGSELLWFVARAAPRARQGLPVPQCVRVVEHLLASRQRPSPWGCHAPPEAQRLVIGVLAAQGPLPPERRDALVAQASQQGFFGVASWLHERHGEYGRVLDCRLQDQELRPQIFDYIVARLAELAGDPAEAGDLVDAALQRLQRLVALDAERCAGLICDQLTAVADHTAVLSRLQGHPEIELLYLETLLVLRRQGQWRRLGEQQAFFEVHVVRYVELLCSLRPSGVLPFIVENEALPLRECLELCNMHQVTDASIHLLERTGDFAGVLELLLSDYSKALALLGRCFVEARDQNRAVVAKVLKRVDALAGAREAEAQASAGKDPTPEAPWWEGCKEAQRCVELLEQAYEMSSRNSNIMTDAQLEELWFGVLGRTVRSQERARAEPSSKRHAGLSAALGELKSKAMSGVLAYLSLPAALKWICSEFGPSALGVWKEPLESMLSGLSFQQGLLRAAKAVAAQDVTKPFMAIKRKGSRGVRLSPQGEVLSTRLGDKPVEVRFVADAAARGAQPSAARGSGGGGGAG